MTEHTHTTLVAGCYRCELSKDEMDAITAEQDKHLAAVMRRMLEEKSLRPMPRGHEYTLNLAMQIPIPLTIISEEEWDVLTDVQDFDEVPK